MKHSNEELKDIVLFAGNLEELNQTGRAEYHIAGDYFRSPQTNEPYVNHELRCKNALFSHGYDGLVHMISDGQSFSGLPVRAINQISSRKSASLENLWLSQSNRVSEILEIAPETKITFPLPNFSLGPRKVIKLTEDLTRHAGFSYFTLIDTKPSSVQDRTVKQKAVILSTGLNYSSFGYSFCPLNNQDFLIACSRVDILDLDPRNISDFFKEKGISVRPLESSSYLSSSWNKELEQKSEVQAVDLFLLKRLS